MKFFMHRFQACDIASHLYSFSFFPNPFWSRAYSKQVEIRTYLEGVASYFKVYPNIKFSTKVTNVEWDDQTKTYTVSTYAGEKFVGNFIINGAGALHYPKIPKFNGMEDFKKPLFHTAQWRKDVDIKGKRVGVIGTGASAVQVVPNICDEVKSLHVFQRTPGWVPPRFDGPYKQATQVIN